MKQPIRTTMLLKQQNKELILSAFREIGQGTRNEIAQLTGLSISTCGNIIRDLLKSGELREGELAPSLGGRPSKVYIYNANMSLALAISLVTNKDFNQIELATVNLSGVVLTKESYMQPLHSLSFDFLDTLIARQVSVSPEIKVIGIGIPGMVVHGEVLYCDIEELDHLNLQEMLQSKYHVKVFIDNEMHFKAFGYHQTHTDMNLKNFALVNVPEEQTYGAGFIVNNRLIRGNANFSGEINYLPYVSSRKELIRQCAEDESLISLISKVLISIITITDPKTIVLCGFRFNDSLLQQVQEKISKTLPAQLLPEFYLQRDISDEYLTGIISVIQNLLIGQEPYEDDQF